MDAPASGVEPRDVTEAKVVPQAVVHDSARHLHERPTDGTDFGPRTAAVPDVVVVREVDVKDELPLDRTEGAVSVGRVGVLVLGGVGEDGPEVDLPGLPSHDGRPQVVLVVEALVPDVDFLPRDGFESEGELPPGEGLRCHVVGAVAVSVAAPVAAPVVAVSCAVVRQPRMEERVREESGVVHLQQFWAEHVRLLMALRGGSWGDRCRGCCGISLSRQRVNHFSIGIGNNNIATLRGLVGVAHQRRRRNCRG